MSDHTPVEQLGAHTLDSETRKRLDAIFAEWDSNDSPGVALGIYQNNQLVYSRGYGMSNLEHGVPISPSSIFHIASISKQFAGFAIALLEAEGALRVDEDIRTWLPDVPDFGSTITLTHLMNHTSGIRDQWSLLNFAGWREEDLVTDDDVMELVKRQRELNFAPGEQYLYSNTGYTLMSLIVKEVSGKSLREFCQERVFGPLGMDRTHFHDNHAEIVPGRTQAYQKREDGGYVISIPEFDVAGATSLQSTVEDFCKWNAHFTTMQLTTPEVMEKFQASGVLNNGEKIDYGYGIATQNYRGVQLIGHSGADHGYRAEYQRAPEHGIGVTVFANLSAINPGGLAKQVFDVLLEDVLQPAEVKSEQPVVSGTAPSDLVQFAGVFRHEKDAMVVLTEVREGSLHLGLEESKALSWLGDDTFRLDLFPQSRLRFDRDADGTVTTLRLNLGYGESVLERVSAPDTIDIEEFAGEYWSEELGVSWSIEIRNGTPTMIRRKRKPAELRACGPDTLAGGGYFGFLMELKFERDGKGVHAFRLNQGRIRNLRFVRR